jgi:asparagine synthase (glutamine-hydrolysing)
MLRGPVLAAMPFFDERKVIGLLDRLHAMDEGLGVANDQVLMIVMSAAVLHDRFRVSA